MRSPATILGIETSCDETAASVVRGGVRGGVEVLSSVVASQDDLHAEYGGVVPELASRAHSERILPVIRKALSDAGLTLRDLDAIAVGHRPGLIGSLLIGVGAAKALAWSLGVPLIGVDHVHAHLYAGLLSGAESESDVLPAMGLVVSGGHTSIYHVREWNDLSRLGSTIDDAMGEAFDKVGAMLGLPFPCGPAVERLASMEGADDHAFEFPISRLARESLDFSFSGLKTSVLYVIRGTPAVPRFQPLSEIERASVAASFQRAAVKAVEIKLDRAMLKLHGEGVDVQTLLAGGGVTANSALREMLATWGRRHGVRLVLPKREHCVDNAAMIAGIAHPIFVSGHRDDLSLSAVPTTAC